MANRHFRWLFALAGLFVLRVLAQLIQAVQPVSILPPFDAWHGAVLPYPVLVASQIVLVLVFAIILVRVRRETIIPRRWKYRVCFALGGVYFAFMAFRFVSGLTFFVNDAWFAKHLPAFFHVVLASFILVLGHYIYRRAMPDISQTGQDGRD